jgi:hypothetical protein
MVLTLVLVIIQVGPPTTLLLRIIIHRLHCYSRTLNKENERFHEL